MRDVVAVFGRELRGSFEQPSAWIVLALFVGMFATLTLWFDDVLVGGVASMRRPFVWISVCFLFLVPAVTMRLFAEEYRTGTIHVLATLPIDSTRLVVGKWLAAVALVGIALATTLSWPIALAVLGDLDWGPVAAGYLGLFLAGAGFAAIGTATSALTESQVVAFLLALCACLVPWLSGQALGLFPTRWAPFVQLLTFEHHFGNLARGVVDTRSLLFFGGLIVVALRVAVLILEHRRLS